MTVNPAIGPGRYNLICSTVFMVAHERKESILAFPAHNLTGLGRLEVFVKVVTQLGSLPPTTVHVFQGVVFTFFVSFFPPPSTSHRC